MKTKFWVKDWEYKNDAVYRKRANNATMHIDKDFIVIVDNKHLLTRKKIK